MSFIYGKEQIKIKQVAAGDSVDIEFDLGFRIKKEERIKLARIVVEKPEAKAFLEKALTEAEDLKIVTYKAGKSNTYLADIFINGKSINNEMLAQGLVKEFKFERGSRQGKQATQSKQKKV